MQIGGATSFPAPAVNSLQGRPVASSVSPDVSPDITRAAQSPVSAAQPLADEQSASAREEADKSADSNQSKSSQDEQDPRQQRLEQLEIAKLVSRDQEVRTHEQAHAAVGGQYAGAPTYTYTRGPDGKRYAVGGEVGIDTSPVPNDPQATLRKMEVVIRAALAPAEPSGQDRQIAAQAQAQMAEARAQLAQQQRTEAQTAREQRAEQRKEASLDEEEEQSAVSAQQGRPPPPSLDLYRQLSDLQEPAPVVDLVM